MRQAYAVSGSLSGSFEVDYRIIVAGPCASAAPGIFNEEWIAHGKFTGTANGSAVSATLAYTADVEAGGDIRGRIVFGDGLAGELRVGGSLADSKLSYNGQLW